jgi:O-antigen ligase
MTFTSRIQRFALYLFLFSINFEVWDPFNTLGYFSISKLTGFIYLLAMIPRIIFFNTNKEFKKILRPLWLFYGLLTLVSILNINSYFSNFFDFTLFQNIILFWILINHEQKDPQVLEKGMLSFAFGSIVLALLFNAKIGIEYNSVGRVSIFGDNQNNTGIRTSISMVILILSVVQNRLQISNKRYLLLLPIPLMLKLIFESGSRVSIIAFLLAFMTGVFLFKTKRPLGKIMVLVCGLIALLCIWQFLVQDEVIRLRLIQSIKEGDISERDVIWKNLLPLIKSNPIIGVGKTGYSYFSQSTFSSVESPHNVILELLCYTGIIGLIIFLIFLYRIFLISFQNFKTSGLLLPLLLFYPIMGMIVSSHILEVKIGWVIFAYIVGGSYDVINEKTSIQ